MKIFIYIAYITLLCSCSRQISHNNDTPVDSTVQAYNTLKRQYEEMTALWPEVNSRDCRVLAEIVRIYPVNPTGRLNQPCDEHPCMTRIKILKVEKRGSSFSGNIKEGQSLTANFIYSLDPSVVAFPEMEPPLAGLKLGDKFKADLSLEFTDRKEKTRYLISKYIKEEN
ncbi:MAG: hypothetical protein AAF363_22535 [Bacteroidota bacterium]